MAERRRRDNDRTTSGPGRLASGAFALVALVALLGACASSSSSSSSSSTSDDISEAAGATDGCPDWPACGTTVPESSGSASAIQLRPVLAVNAPPGTDRPCPTSSEAATPDAIVVVPRCTDGLVETIYSLAPVVLDGSAFASARAVEDVASGGWVVSPVLKLGPDGVDAFNTIASRCFESDSSCPTGELAIVADGIVISAPTIQAPTFEADEIQISGTPFTQAEATELAARIAAAG